EGVGGDGGAGIVFAGGGGPGGGVSLHPGIPEDFLHEMRYPHLSALALGDQPVPTFLLLAASLLPAADADVADLVKKLSSKDNEVRRSAASDLADLGKDAKDAVPALTKALKDKDLYVRRFAAQALGK